MAKILITGARGFIGTRLIESLANDNEIVAFLRPNTTLSSRVSEHPNIQVAFGDIRDYSTLLPAMEGVDQVYHLAAFAQPWAKDQSTYHQINVLGKENVVRAAIEMGVQKVLVTSSAGTFGPQVGNEPITEGINQVRPLSTDYEKTKKEGVERAFNLAKGKIEICAVSPTRVYGPGPLSTSNAVTKLINSYINGAYRFVPGDGNTTGNYVFVEDVIQGHILAMQNGKDQHNYILGGENLSYQELFNKVGEHVGKKKSLVGIPIWLMLGISKGMEFAANNFGITPAITPPFVRKYTYNWATDISKASSDLNYNPLSFEEGLAKTVAWLNESQSR